MNHDYRVIDYPLCGVRQGDLWHHSHRIANHPLEIPSHRVERVDEMTISYILRAIQAYASTAEGRQGPLGDSLYGRKAYEAIARLGADGRALIRFDY